MVTLSLRERGWRDAFWGRDAQEADEAYLEGWEAGARKGDRTPRAVTADPQSESEEVCE